MATKSRRGDRAWALRSMVGAILWAASVVHGGAAAQGQTVIPEAQKNVLEKVLDLMEACVAGGDDKTLSTGLGQGGGSDVGYESTDGRDTTFGDMVRKLREMLAGDRLTKGAFDGRGRTRVRSGTDADHIDVNQDTLDRLLLGTPKERAAAKFALAATLANEGAHVFQEFNGNDSVQCDAERDSDVASLKFLCRIIEALTDGAGNPHATLVAVAADPRAVSGLAACLAGFGVADADLADIVTELRARKKGYEDRKAQVFDANIAAMTSWGTAYYGAEWSGDRLLNFPRDVSGAVEMTALNGTTTRTFAVPPGQSVDHSATFASAAGPTILVLVGAAPTGNRSVGFFVDQDGDLLPEAVSPGPMVPLNSIPGIAPTRSIQIHRFSGSAAQLSVSPHILFHDTFAGSLTYLPLSGGGLPSGPPQPLLTAPQIAASGGGFIYLADVVAISPTVVRCVFSAEAPGLAFGHVAVAAWDLPLPLFSAPPTMLAAGTTLAQARAPGNPVGVESIEVGQATDIVLSGNPSSTVSIRSIGRGGSTTLATATIGADGRSANLYPASALDANDLFEVDDGTRRAEYYLPRRGGVTDRIASDESGDGVPELLVLSADPPRLHLLSGITSGGPMSPIKNFADEMLLEFDARAITTWNDIDGRILRTPSTMTPMIAIPGTSPRLYASALRNFSGGGVDDAVVAHRPVGAASWFVDFFASVSIPSSTALIQRVTLPTNFEPASLTVVDADFDGDLDVCLFDDIADVGAELIQTAGTFVFSPTLPSGFIGSGEGFDMTVTVGDSPTVCRVAPVEAGDLLTITITTTNPNFWQSGLIGAGQFFFTGFPPPSVPSFPYLHLNPSFPPFDPFLFLGDATLLGPIPLALPSPFAASFAVPPGLDGLGLSLMMQALVISPSASNGFFGTSNSVEVRFP